MIERYTRRWEDERRARRRGRESRPQTAAQAARSSYYGVPAIHKPHWKWLIIVYFYLGGISGASYVIASIAELVGPKSDKHVVRAGRFVSFLAFLPCPLLLILDLGRPERFLMMLRVVKFRSPMSVGTWGLLLFSAFSTLSAAIQAADDGLLGRNDPARLLSRLPRRAIGALGIVPGFFLSGYTGVLLGATAVPLWAKNVLLMGPLFLASALSAAASAISLVLAARIRTPPSTVKRLESVERVAMATEAGLLIASRAKLGETAKPLTEGRTAAAMRVGAVGAGIVAPAVLQIVNRRHARSLIILGSLLALIGGFLLRYAIVTGGRASADDPQATFEFARDDRSERAKT